MPGTLSKGRLWLREWIFSLRNLMFCSINPQCCEAAAQSTLGAAGSLRLLPTSISDMYKVFELIDMLSIDIWLEPYKDIPTPLGSDFGVLGNLWSQHDVITSWLRLTANSNYLLHPYETNTEWLSSLICCPWANNSSLTALHINTHTTWLKFWGSGSLVESKWNHYIMVEADSHLRLLPKSIWDIYKVFEHIDMLSIDVWLSLTWLYPHYLAQILGYWVTCGVKMMSLHQSWGWQPTQTIYCIHLKHIQII